jgi:AcrR family transcriptional regulator
MTDPQPIGRRERKKAATRKTISDIATLLFIERGFDAVSIREVADAADVSPTTVFAHFPQKEALVFDEDDEQREQLVAAVRDRAEGVGVLEALRAFYERELRANAEEHREEGAGRFLRLLEETPSLRDYAARMWLRHEDSLAAAMAESLGVAEPSLELRVAARFVLQVQILVMEAPEGPEQSAALDAGFAVLERGWPAVAAGQDEA